MIWGFKYSVLENGAGRPSYDPHDLLKIYLWGYYNAIRCSRKLAVTIFNMLSKNQHFVDDYMFKALYERKLKNMESRRERAHEFKLEDMEK